MPSSRSQLVSFFLKRLVKPRGRQPFDVERVRRAAESALSLARWVHRGVLVRPGQLGSLSGEWLHPSGASQTIILYLHGGGYFFGSPLTHRALTSTLARMSLSKVFALRYRLAPEHPFPAALEDALSAYRHLLDQGQPADQIVLAGDSAGGGLTLATLVQIQQNGWPLPAGGVCFSPWTDLAGTGFSLRRNDPSCAMFHGDAIIRSASLYVGRTDPRHPLVSPLYANLEGLPPLLVQVSDSEVLFDDSRRLVEKARQQGILTELGVWSGQPHVWQLFAGFLPEAGESLGRAAQFIRNRTGSDQASPFPLC